MAIEFNCPYCTASIRVPDGAGGKKGRCPKCETELLVPLVQPAADSEPSDSAPASAPTPAPAPPQQPAAAQTGVAAPPASRPPSEPPPPDSISEMPSASSPQFPAVGPPGAASPAPFDPLGVAGPPGGASAPRPSIAKALKKRQRKKKSNLAIPLAFASVLIVGISTWYVIANQEEPLRGNLKAVEMERPDLPPQYVGRSQLVGVPKGVIDQVLSDLERNPLPAFRSSKGLITMRIRGSKRGLGIHLETMPKARFYRVDLRSNRRLAKFIDANVTRLNDPRHEELSQAAEQFFDEYQSTGGSLDPKNLIVYRNQLGINACIGGIGYAIGAKVGDEFHPCVYEDGSGAYFALPEGITRFEILGREMDDGNSLFPGQYKVKVTRPAQKKDQDTDQDEPPAEEPEAEAADDPEMASPDEPMKMQK